MKIDNVDFELYVDYIERSVHLLEISRNYNSGLLNAMSPDFQREVLKQGLLLLDVLEFSWICYGLNGLVMEYKDYGLLFVSKSENRLHKPFLDGLEAY